MFEAKALKQLRLGRRLTQEDLARKTGLTTSTISKLESGTVTAPHFKTTRELARVLGVPEDDLDSA